MVHMKTSHNAIARIPRYRDALCRFKAYGSTTVYSCDIADILGLSAAQVRKDFSMFRFSGRKKVGYHVDRLIADMDLLMRRNETRCAVLCGPATPLELLCASHGIVIAATVGAGARAAKNPAIPEIPADSLCGFIADNAVRFGIITTPGAGAQRWLDLLVLAGVKGVLNLSGVDLKSSKNCLVASVNVVREFEKMVYLVNNRHSEKNMERV
jgi:redox-sensing transcriptional repressor